MFAPDGRPQIDRDVLAAKAEELDGTIRQTERYARRTPTRRRLPRSEPHGMPDISPVVEGCCVWSYWRAKKREVAETTAAQQFAAGSTALTGRAPSSTARAQRRCRATPVVVTAVASVFEIDAVIDRVTECNCSICSKKGILHFRVPPENFRLLSGDEHLGTYQFGTMVAKHHFCSVCGIHTFTPPSRRSNLYTVNVALPRRY